VTLRLRTKLSVVFLGAAMVAMVVVVGMMFVVRDLAASVHDMERLAARISLTDRLQLGLSRLLVPLNDYLLTEDVRHRDAFDRSITDISQRLNELQHLDGGIEWTTVTSEINDRVIQLGTMSVDVLFVDRPVGNPDVIRLMQDVNRLSDDIISRASRLHQIAADDMTRREKTAVAKSAHVNRLLIGLVLATPLGMIAFYFLLTRWVTKPLLALHRGVIDLQAGRSARIPVQVRDEIGEVGQAFNDLADHLSASQEQVQQHTRQLEALYTASRALSKESSREVLYQTLTDLARSLTESRYAVLALFNDEERVIQVVESGVAPFAAGLSDPGIREMIARLPRSRRPLCIGEKGDDPRLRSLPCSPPLRTLLAVPLFAETALRGELYAMQKIHGTYTTADQDLVATIAHDASQSLKVIRLHEEAERLATIDGLTGFANRWAFEDRLAEEFMKAGRRARPFALIFSDFDRLKDINDRCGHATGDAAIRRFCDAIRASIRTTDIVGRYGGDEILVLMPETVLDDALVVAERILRRLAGVPFTAAGQTMTLTASLGVAAYPEHGRDKEGLLRAADYALYQAKTLGRSRVHTFQASAEAKSPRG
jgi:diguanylate cyclase (GGDEF)-like protein